MASLSSSAVLPRGRAARSAPNAKHTQHASITSNSVTSGTNLVTAPHATPTAHPSNLSLFLANLRILDLDLLPDWPGITTNLFTSGSASQGQKKRVQCVEWALYQLFLLWDPDETRNKLQPFFPPLEQVQSLNLRAALLRGLEQAKRNGVLGRDTVVRKTMLDDCRGERLEEVLAAISAAVLRKVVAEDSESSGYYPAVAQAFALENRGYTGERKQLPILTLAHKVSLRSTLQHKAEARGVFRDFAELLDLKQRTLARRHEQIKAIDSGKQAYVSVDERMEAWKLVRHNWAGNERWIDALFYGDSNGGRDVLLKVPFDRVWRRVQAGQLAEVDDRGDGLLVQLESRVVAQHKRLEKWQSLRKKMLAHCATPVAPAEDTPVTRKKGIDLRFDMHQGLHTGRMSPRKGNRPKSTNLTSEYSQLLHDFELALSQVGCRTGKGSTTLKLRRGDTGQHLQVERATEEPISEISDLEDHTHPPPQREEPRISSMSSMPSMPFGKGARPVTEPVATQGCPPTSEPPPPEGACVETEQLPQRSPTRSSPTRSSRTQRNRDPTVTARRKPTSEDGVNNNSVQPVPFMTPVQEQADQILASMDAASPSPAKCPKPRHTLSLAERTRLSMARQSQARTSASDEEDADPLPLIHLAPPKPIVIPLTDEESEERDGYENLVARTRKSMAGFEAAKQKARLERRRSERKSRAMSRREGSHFPKVDEEAAGELLDASHLAEELMDGGQEDYEAVFMSRPKIKTSPLPSPSRK